jgi:hypothetical protein
MTKRSLVYIGLVWLSPPLWLLYASPLNQGTFLDSSFLFAPMKTSTQLAHNTDLGALDHISDPSLCLLNCSVVCFQAWLISQPIFKPFRP